MEPGEVNPSYFPRPLPPPLAGLAELALDLRWNWNHSADALWQSVAPELWEATGNAWLILESVSHRRLEELARDPEFLAALQQQMETRADYLRESTWFSDNYGDAGLHSVAYFSMEFGLGEALPIYSGGLGILAGDHLKTASDLGVPVIGVGLLYQRGYFRQAFDAAGNQIAYYPFNDPTLLPALPLRDADGEWLRVEIDLPGRTLHLRSWQVQVGRTRLYLLDSNHPLNTPRDRGITGELYGGNPETRLEQELVLGIGGWQLLETLGIEPEVCHLNEGHPAFMILARAHSFMARSGNPFNVALRCTAAGNLFTTHTPVAAAFDRFPPELVAQYLGGYARERLGIGVEELLSLGRRNPADGGEPFHMAYLAVRGCTHINGVSRLHGEVSREIFAPLFPRWPLREVPVGHITNGVHMPSWDSAAADELWTGACGKARWLGDLATLERQFRQQSSEALWTFRCRARGELVRNLRTRLLRQQRTRGEERRMEESAGHLLDPNALVIGFARRFALYKRPQLLLHDPERLLAIVSDPLRPVQIIVAGKAHPRDQAGQQLLRQWADFMRMPQARGRVVFVEDYDIGFAAELVQGVDLWINTPRRPWEASGTSGMKALVNGGLNLSELDGWWAEAYSPEVGWAIGDGRTHEEDQAAWDGVEAEQLYTLLEREIVPLFYRRDDRGIPQEWVQRVRESMSRLTPLFSANRMLREYTERYYLRAAEAWQRRSAGEGRLGAAIEQWRAEVRKGWGEIRFGEMALRSEGGEHRLQLPIYLGEVDPALVRAELFAEPGDPEDRYVWEMERGDPLTGSVNGFLFTASVPADRPIEEYTARVVPCHPDADTPLEAMEIAWQK